MTDGEQNILLYHILTIPSTMLFFSLLLTKNGLPLLNHYLTVKLPASQAFSTNFSNIFLMTLRNILKISSRFVSLLHIYHLNGKKPLSIPFQNHKNGTATSKTLVLSRF